jgi:hypothetical protein
VTAICFAVYPADIDADGAVDVACATQWEDPSLVWYRNDGASAPQFSAQLIAEFQYSLVDVVVADFNSDGALDIMTASWVGHHHNWWSSDGGASPTLSLQAIDVSGVSGAFGWDEPFTSHLTDLDRDGDLDLVSCSLNSFSDSSLIWYENDGSPTGNVDQHVVPSVHLGFASFASGDLDADGDVDFLSHYSPELAFGWYEQTSEEESFVHHGLLPVEEQIIAKVLTDIDGDGDPDILLLRDGEGGITVFQNNLTHGGTQVATEGTDYESASGSLTFGAGEASKTIEVVVLDDAETEVEERILLDLLWPSGVETITSQSIITIVDDD